MESITLKAGETPASVVAQRKHQVINSFKALARVPPPIGQEFSVFAYFLVDPPKDTQKPYDPVGMYILLGSYHLEEDALKRVNHLIETTGHKQICAISTCSWRELTGKCNPNQVTLVPVDLNGKLVKQHNKEQEEEKKALERRKEIEEEIIREKDLETDPNSLEHYIHNWFVAVKNRSTHHIKMKEAEEARLNYEKRVDAIREQHARQPELEDSWLDELKVRLEKRGEESLYRAMVKAVKEMRVDIFANEKKEEVVVKKEEAVAVPKKEEAVAVPKKEETKKEEEVKEVKKEEAKKEEVKKEEVKKEEVKKEEVVVPKKEEVAMKEEVKPLLKKEEEITDLEVKPVEIPLDEVPVVISAKPVMKTEDSPDSAVTKKVEEVPLDELVPLSPPQSNSPPPVQVEAKEEVKVVETVKAVETAKAEVTAKAVEPPKTEVKMEAPVKVEESPKEEEPAKVEESPKTESLVKVRGTSKQRNQ